MKALLSRNAWFFYPWLLFLGVGGIWLYTGEKGGFVKFLNEVSNPWSDHFFTQYTNLGDGIFVTILCLTYLFSNRRYFFAAASALICTSLLSQVLKHSIGAQAFRPRKFFEGLYEFRDIPFLNPHELFSMPSGHTAAAFCIFSMMAFCSEKRTMGYLAFVAAFLVGLSRMYLAQHFEADVIAGSFIGVSLSVIFFLLFQRIQKPGFDRPLIRL